MRIVVALGGNALLRRGAPLTSANQLASIELACTALAPAAAAHELVITHGNGPQVGLLALQAAAYDEISGYTFDILDAQTEGMIGYLIERELRNLLPPERQVATLVTMTRVRLDDPAFAEPTKFVGPVYGEARAKSLATERGWSVRADGAQWRRVVASPVPESVVETPLVRQLLDSGCVVICAGGGGVPTALDPATGLVRGVEAVVDKDRTSAVLALDISADRLIIATDVPAVQADWGTDHARAIATAHPDDLDQITFPEGSMGPKIAAAALFARSGKGDAVIGSLADLGDMLDGLAGTLVSTGSPGITYR
jgi:carbamate kinase